MIQTFVDFFKNKDIRKKIGFTLVMLFIFRLGAAIPAPGINDTIINLANNSILGMMNLLGDGWIRTAYRSFQLHAVIRLLSFH